jgi:hypothetical protein
MLSDYNPDSHKQFHHLHTFTTVTSLKKYNNVVYFSPFNLILAAV